MRAPLATLMMTLWIGLIVVVPRPQSVIAQTASVPAQDLEASRLVDWMDLLYTLVEREAVSAPGGARLYAYAGVAAYAAVHSGLPDAIDLSRYLNELGDVPAADPNETYDWVSVSNGTLSTVIAAIFDSPSTESKNRIQALRDRQITAQKRDVDAETVDRSIAYGDVVGNFILEWLANDHYADTRQMDWTLPTGDASYWVPTEPNQEAVEPYWGLIRPFVLPEAGICEVPQQIVFSTEPGSAFYQQALEVKTVSEQLTQDQREISRFWVDTPGVTGTPAGHWILIGSQMVDLLDLNLADAARMYLVVGVSVGDAFISAWETKYQDNLLRPVTYIQRYIEPTWAPTWANPGFPEYPSGHSVVSGAGATALTQLFGTVAFTDTSVRRHGMNPRNFDSFEAAASEAAISRLYGGIHYREAIESGLEQGRCVAEYAVQMLDL